MTTEPGDLDATRPWLSETVAPEVPGPLPPGHVVGRYRLEGVLGEGTYGRVHLARHEVLKRRVAIKILHDRHGSGRREIRAFLNEALILADLDHPGIVPVLDAGWEEVGLYYIVSKYIEGGDLGQLIRTRRLGHQEAARIIDAVAGALHYAHTRGLVHRDIKPANILIDPGGRPCLADFGVALRDRDFGRGARHIGTPAYMSPEQARGAGHRVDGRSDVFSLGVVLYELLTGQRPFRGETREALAQQVARCEVRPPREVDELIPDELERVCLKAMARMPGRRYATARDMAEDLSRFLGDAAAGGVPVAASDPGGMQASSIGVSSTRDSTPTWAVRGGAGAGPRGAGILPRGLHPYGVVDAEFYPDLLPGPRDHNGLPEAIGSWRSKIEGAAGDAFRVGLIFGPAGVGKTSFVRAGLLPRLSGRIIRVYTEASAEGTESRLLEGITRRFPDLPGGADLAATLLAIRKGTVLPPGRKALLVIDRFERWLRGGRGSGERALVAALLQCDGEHLQALVVVRDDSWVAASRFMRDLDEGIVEGGNTSALEPFDLGHARRVLEWFGRASGAFPAEAGELTADQGRFLDRAVSGLAEGGQVLPIRLAMLAGAVRDRAWSPGTLEAIRAGDPGLAFLEAAFDAAGASAGWRRHRAAVRAVLGACLAGNAGEGGRTHRELLAAAGPGVRPEDLEAVLRGLVDEVGLLTRIEPEGADDSAGDPMTGVGEARYGLARDHLAAPLRAWLERETPGDGEGPNRAVAGPRASGRMIDINAATVDELNDLPGVGPAIARRIVEGRPYRTVDDLLRVRGMSRMRLSRLRRFVDLG